MSQTPSVPLETKSRIWRQGNSLVITIPAAARDAMRLREGDYLTLSIQEEKLCITKDRTGKQVSGKDAVPVQI